MFFVPSKKLAHIIAGSFALLAFKVNTLLTISMLYGCRREVLSIHIGQAGVQVGNACWEVRSTQKICCPLKQRFD
jgi:hypothetical protein